jgi:hypothetical protein
MCKLSSERVCQGLRFFFFMKFVLLEKTKQELRWLSLFKQQLQQSNSSSPHRNRNHRRRYQHQQPHTVTQLSRLVCYSSHLLAAALFLLAELSES